MNSWPLVAFIALFYYRTIESYLIYHKAVEKFRVPSSLPSFTHQLASNSDGEVRMIDSFKKEKDTRRKLGFVVEGLGKSAKFFVSLAASVVLLRDEAVLPLYYITIAVTSGVVCKILKSILKQPRPPGSSKKDYGMPSSHTTIITYFAIILHFTSGIFLSDNRLRKLLDLAVLVYVLSACGWRILKQLHSPLQILVGGVVGASFAAAASYMQESFLAWAASLSPSVLTIFSYKTALACLVLPILFKKEIKSIAMFLSKRLEKSMSDKQLHC